MSDLYLLTGGIGLLAVAAALTLWVLLSEANRQYRGERQAEMIRGYAPTQIQPYMAQLPADDVDPRSKYLVICEEDGTPRLTVEARLLRIDPREGDVKVFFYPMDLDDLVEGIGRITP